MAHPAGPLGVFVTGFRVKIVIFLIVYFAGIATGIVLAMPTVVQRGGNRTQAIDSSSKVQVINGVVVKTSRTARVEAHPANRLAMQDTRSP
jgi:hypothetical protein